MWSFCLSQKILLSALGIIRCSSGWSGKVITTTGRGTATGGITGSRNCGIGTWEKTAGKPIQHLCPQVSTHPIPNSPLLCKQQPPNFVTGFYVCILKPEYYSLATPYHGNQCFRFDVFVWYLQVKCGLWCRLEVEIAQWKQQAVKNEVSELPCIYMSCIHLFERNFFFLPIPLLFADSGFSVITGRDLQLLQLDYLQQLIIRIHFACVRLMASHDSSPVDSRIVCSVKIVILSDDTKMCTIDCFRKRLKMLSGRTFIGQHKHFSHKIVHLLNHCKHWQSCFSAPTKKLLTQPSLSQLK